MSRLIDPGEGAFSITPNDSSDLESPIRWLYVGSAGNVKVEMVTGDEVIFTGMLAGTLYPLKIRKVFNTNTTASNLLGIY